MEISLYFVIEYNTSLLIVLLKLFHLYQLGVPSAVSWVSLTCSHHCGLFQGLPSFLALYHAPGLSRISKFFKYLCFFSLENGHRKQELVDGCACCYWGVIVSSPSQLGAGNYTCVD